jgi:hypothetical protein
MWKKKRKFNEHENNNIHKILEGELRENCFFKRAFIYLYIIQYQELRLRNLT